MPDLIERTMAVLRINGERWQALATGIDRELLARRPEPGEWSALECLGHTVDTEEAIFTWRIRGFLTGVEVLPGYDPDVQGTPVTDATDPVELAKQLAPRRAANVDLLATLSRVRPRPGQPALGARSGDAPPVPQRVLGARHDAPGPGRARADAGVHPGDRARGARTSPTTTSKRGRERGEGAVAATLSCGQRYSNSGCQATSPAGPSTVIWTVPSRSITTMPASVAP